MVQTGDLDPSSVPVPGGISGKSWPLSGPNSLPFVLLPSYTPEAFFPGGPMVPSLAYLLSESPI